MYLDLAVLLGTDHPTSRLAAETYIYLLGGEDSLKIAGILWPLNEQLCHYKIQLLLFCVVLL